MIRKIRFLLILLIVSSTLLLALASCSKAVAGDAVTLDFAGNSGASTISSFDEQDSIVLRCASWMESENGLVLNTSKSKDMKVGSLVFVKLPDVAGPEDLVEIASVPISGQESDYDMARASFYSVTYSSAELATREFGIPYATWQAGAVSGSEKFPCCE